MKACENQNIPVSEILNIKTHCDISACFDPPLQLSEKGSKLLDFLTHTINFAQNAPADYRDDIMHFLRSEACSERGPVGQVLFKTDTVAFIIKANIDK